MTRSAQYIATINDGQSTQDLVDRWKSPEYAKLARAIREAIGKGEELPTNIPMVTATFADGAVDLADLRGIDLSSLALKGLDLSYCCFKGANFTGTKFVGTHVQYSSFENAKLDDVVWKEVQASPIFANSASFRSAHIENSFLMGASLNGAHFDDAKLTNTALVGSTFAHSSLDHASVLLSLDITETILTDSLLLRHSLQEAIGQPLWIQHTSATPPPGNKLSVSLILDGIKKHLGDIASKMDDLNVQVGTVVHKVTPFIAEVAVFSTSHQSSFSVYKNHLHLNQGIKSKSQERLAPEYRMGTVYPTGKLKAAIYVVDIKRGTVDLGDTVQLEKVRPTKNRKISRSYYSSRHELIAGTATPEQFDHHYKISKIIEKRSTQSASVINHSAHDIPIKKVRSLAAKKAGKCGFPKRG